MVSWESQVANGQGLVKGHGLVALSITQYLILTHPQARLSLQMPPSSTIANFHFLLGQSSLFQASSGHSLVEGVWSV